MARSITFQSRTFGVDPAELYERQQAEEENQRKRGTLHAKPGWSQARRAAEALFAPASAHSSSPGTPRNADHAGDGKDSA